MIHKKIIVALDINDLNKTLKIVRTLKDDVYAFKIGYEFFFNFGLTGYKKIYSICPKIFLDLKLHDIPNTVKKGLEALIKIKPIFTTIHISGGDNMMKSCSSRKNKFTKVIGVSILTSMDNKQVKKYYNQNNLPLLVKKFAKLAKKNSIDGIVCSPKEIKYIRKEVGKNFLIITPGIRINNNVKGDDQKRVESPKKAIDLGANFLVIGRPITESNNPLKVLRDINQSLS
tara:strand:- start:473 stop:1159 length:687 start_codon:yes stop_codon:yes gene_type:complete